MKSTFPLIFCLLAGWLSPLPGYLQDRPALRLMTVISPEQRARDSVMAIRIPLVDVPREILVRTLPASVDNSQSIHWPTIQDQYAFYSCQQYAGAVYTFGYEINRVRNRNGKLAENYYPAHYTWNFLNKGDRYTGVDFLHSFDVIRQQGHMTGDDYGFDTATGVLGWISGYDKYYRAMKNRIRGVKAIQTNSTDGILALKNFLFDHLDGSPEGGIACFTTSAYNLGFLVHLPAGTPEAGKWLINGWHYEPTHGMTVVGYNDSIRFDVNGDGKYTNNLDITGDGKVDARDWEIGGFKIANSWGFWWADTGFAYSLYRNFALDYSDGGIWNNRVYLVEADPGYSPLLTVKADLEYNARNLIRIRAGVSGDTLDEMPAHVIDFPLFGFQGGANPLKGYDTLPEPTRLEVGLDLTPLLNFIQTGEPARYFLMVEERDPGQYGNGKIRSATFINYASPVSEATSRDTGVSILPDGVTMVSAVASFRKPDVQITTASLPPVPSLQPPGFQLEATGGSPPYDWSVPEEYLEKPTSTPEPQVLGSSVVVHSDTRHFATVALPFPFPFYGKIYDTVYVNHYGFLCFEPQNLPAPYTIDETAMLRMFPVIVPSFSLNYTFQANKGDGIWIQYEPGRIIIRWKFSVSPYVTTSVDDFAVILFPNGTYEVCYGTMDNQGFLHTFYTGNSKGDDRNYSLRTQWNGNEMAGKSFLFIPPVLPAGLELSPAGKLMVTDSDPGLLYDLPVSVADAGRISDTRTLTLARELVIEHALNTESGDGLQSGTPASLKLVLTNRGTQPLESLILRVSLIDSVLMISDSIYTAGVLPAGQAITIPSAFSFRLRQNAPDGYPVRVKLLALDGSRTWTKEMRFPVVAPTLSLGAPRVEDGYNGLLDPGEVADLVAEISNSGSLTAHNLRMRLTTAMPGISFLSADDLPVDSVRINTAFECRYRVKASQQVPAGSSIPMQLILADSTGPLIVQDFILQVGNRPVALVDFTSSKTSGNAMAAALDSLGVGFDTIGHLAFPLDRYRCIFLILGTATQGNHILTGEEGAALASWLGNGGKLYLESYYTWYYQNNTFLHPMLKYTSKKVPAYFYPDVVGRDSTFADSMAYVYSLPLNFSVFTLEPVAPAFTTFVNTDTPPRSIEIVYDGEDYKTIGTLTAFGGMLGVQPPASQQELMRRYLEFFDLNLAGPFPLFHASETRVCRNQTVTFTDDSFENIVSRNWEFEGGAPAVSNEANPVVTYAVPGKYDVKLTVSDGTNIRTIFKKDYLAVEDCSGVEEPWTVHGRIRVYPNPTRGEVTIAFERNISGPVQVGVYDLSGREVKRAEVIKPDAGGFRLNLRELENGLYVLKVFSAEEVMAVKLIKS